MITHDKQTIEAFDSEHISIRKNSIAINKQECG